MIAFIQNYQDFNEQGGAEMEKSKWNVEYNGLFGSNTQNIVFISERGGYLKALCSKMSATKYIITTMEHCWGFLNQCVCFIIVMF